MTEGQLVCIATEEDMIVATSSGALYVEADEKAMECSFRSLEFVNSMYVGERAKIPVPKLSKNTHSSIRQVLDKGARVEKGLGKRLQGMLRPIAVIQKRDRFSLGYKPDRQERDFLKRKERRESPVSSERRKKVQKWKYCR